MLRHILFVMLFSFSEWLWAGSALSSARCPVKQVKAPVCPLQKKLYLDLGVSKILSTHLSSDQTLPVDLDEKNFHFGVYPAHHATGIFPNTMQIGVGYAWFRNSVNGGVLPYVSVGIEYRQMNPMHAPLTLTTKLFSSKKDNNNESDNGNDNGNDDNNDNNDNNDDNNDNNDDNDDNGDVNYSVGKNKDDLLAAYKSIPLQNSHLFATVKFNPFRLGCVFPYVSAGLGVSWTRAHNQQLNISVIEKEGEKTSHFQLPEIKQTRLGFRLGSGIDIALTQNLLMSIGYSYNNLGRLTVREPRACMEIDSKEIRKLVYSFKTLHLGSLTSHNIEFSIRYLFP